MFELVEEGGWQGGLRNLMRADFGKWFRTRQWLVQSLIWIAVIDGILAGVLWGSPQPQPISETVVLFNIFTAMFPSVAVVIILQDAIVGEREAGTAAWVLSKPVSRTAFILSKLIPNLIGCFLCMILLPGLVAYALFYMVYGASLDPLRFLAGLGVLWIYIAYYLTLTLMLGTLFDHRAPVIGIPLALIFGQQMIFGMLPFLAKVLPWTVAAPLGDQSSSIASALILGQPLPDLTPLYFTIASIIIFVAVALWRFQREEF
jgi:ABC-2 type transport system permease protein